MSHDNTTIFCLLGAKHNPYSTYLIASKEPRSKLRGISEESLKLKTKAEANFGEFNPRD